MVFPIYPAVSCEYLNQMQITTYTLFYIVIIKCISSSVILYLQTLVILPVLRVFLEKVDPLSLTCRDKL